MTSRHAVHAAAEMIAADLYASTRDRLAYTAGYVDGWMGEEPAASGAGSAPYRSGLEDGRADREEVDRADAA